MAINDGRNMYGRWSDRFAFRLSPLFTSLVQQPHCCCQGSPVRSLCLFALAISYWVLWTFCIGVLTITVEIFISFPWVRRVFPSSAEGDSWQPNSPFSWQSILVKCILPEMERNINSCWSLVYSQEYFSSSHSQVPVDATSVLIWVDVGYHFKQCFPLKCILLYICLSLNKIINLVIPMTVD